MGQVPPPRSHRRGLHPTLHTSPLPHRSQETRRGRFWTLSLQKHSPDCPSTWELSPGPPDLREGTGEGRASPRNPRLLGRAGGQLPQQEGPWEGDISPKTQLWSEPGSSTHTHSWDPCSPLHPRDPPKNKPVQTPPLKSLAGSSTVFQRNRKRSMCPHTCPFLHAHFPD